MYYAPKLRTNKVSLYTIYPWRVQVNFRRLSIGFVLVSVLFDSIMH